MKMGYEILVVLAPALFLTGLVFAIEVAPATLKLLHNMMRKASVVESLKEIVAHSAFYGSAIFAVLGFKKEDHGTTILAVVWFFALLIVSMMLGSRLEEIRTEEKTEADREFLETLRRQQQSELDQTAALRNEEGWSD